MANLVLHNGLRVSARQAPMRVASEVTRRISQSAPEGEVEYARWCSEVLSLIKQYVSADSDAELLAQARAQAATWAEQGLEEPRNVTLILLIWSAATDPARADLARIIEPITRPSAKTGVQQRLDRRRDRR